MITLPPMPLVVVVPAEADTVITRVEWLERIFAYNRTGRC